MLFETLVITLFRHVNDGSRDNSLHVHPQLWTENILNILIEIGHTFLGEYYELNLIILCFISVFVTVLGIGK